VVSSPASTSKSAGVENFNTGSDESLIRSGRAVVATEARALDALRPRLGAEFAAAARAMLRCEGRVVLTGMGKSGHVARKIAATLASTGTPSFFVHPAEASHGDLGMITATDAVLMVSYSGATDELLTIVPVLRRQGNILIAMTGRPTSQLARLADVNLDVSVPEEACPLGLAPTASTTASLVMGDALSIALLEARGFTAEDFARSHPSGSLGRRLLMHVTDVMHTGDEVPRVGREATISTALVEMSRKRLGMTAVVDDAGRLVGVFTDGDLRRTLDNPQLELRSTSVTSVMNRTPKSIGPNRLASEAARLMEEHRISALLVIDDQERLVGALNIHDLLRAKVV
jgi:arabinose-5-phosphate isomerase